jgi:hypothetical protein
MVSGLDVDWYLGAERSVAILDKRPVPVVPTAGSLRGAGLAACLGAAAAFKQDIGLPVTPRRVSAWNYLEGNEADPGPLEDVRISPGRVLMVGAGAVASAFTYWMWSWAAEGSWTVVDRDRVALHNTNRSLVFLPSDAGWTSSPASSKADVLCRYLPSARPIQSWYDEALEVHEAVFDVVLALANDRDVRSLLACRNATVMLHATTGENWLSQLHRHVAGHDDCIACRLGNVKAPVFMCSVGRLAPSEAPDQASDSDAALPFLSAASGLMLATSLERLQAGCLTETTLNNWRWDFLSTHRFASAGRSRCRENCRSWLEPASRRRVNVGTKWSTLDKEMPAHSDNRVR